MSERTLDSTIDRFNAAYDTAVDRISRIDAKDRPGAQKELAEILARIERLRPLGDRSHELNERASDAGVYSATANRPDTREILERAEVQARVQHALQGTGIRAEEVTERVLRWLEMVGLEPTDNLGLSTPCGLAGVDTETARHAPETTRVAGRNPS